MTIGLPIRGAGRSPAVLRAALQMSPTPMVLADPHRPHHPTLFCNRAFCDLTGYDEPEVVGRSLAFLQGPRTDPDVLASLHDGIVRLAEVQAELWNYRKDGSAFWNVMTIGPVHAPGGRLLFLLGSLSDGTARRDAGEALLRTQRLDTLGSMAASIAHEFNNLMTVAMGSLEAVASEPLTGPQQDRLQRAQWATNAASRLTRQMLGLAQHRAAEAEAVDLGHAVREIDRVLTQLAGPRMLFEMALTPDPLPVRLDVGELELALINLVRNAVDACPPGARITVATRRGEAGAAELAVGDTGSGMSPELVARVTEPFFTTKPHGKGTGLGLSMVRRFVERSGGALVIASEPGCGTTIRMVFPPA